MRLREWVVELNAKYDELSKNLEVTKALEALSATTKSKQKLAALSTTILQNLYLRTIF